MKIPIKESKDAHMTMKILSNFYLKIKIKSWTENRGKR